MNYLAAYEYGLDRCGDFLGMTEADAETIAADFAARCAGNDENFPGLPETDSIADEWNAYMRDIGGAANLPGYLDTIR